MEKVNTADGSTTYHCSKYDETYHSVSGAIEEAMEKFAKPVRLENGMFVLDVCFGLGYNSMAALKLADVRIVALENDPDIIHEIQNVSVPDEFKEAFEQVIELSKELDSVSEPAETIVSSNNIQLIMGDARESVKGLAAESFDVVFLDPFSPKKCPELWSEEFLKEVYRVMKPNSVLATYSCARVVRDNLKEAGFIVKDGPVVGRKAPSTIAYKL